MTHTLSQLEDLEEFQRRHIGPNAAEQQTMLSTLDMASLEELIDGIVPAEIKLTQPPPVDLPVTETQALAELRT